MQKQSSGQKPLNAITKFSLDRSRAINSAKARAAAVASLAKRDAERGQVARTINAVLAGASPDEIRKIEGFVPGKQPDLGALLKARLKGGRP